jgi:hypothetical protein
MALMNSFKEVFVSDAYQVLNSNSSIQDHLETIQNVSLTFHHRCRYITILLLFVDEYTILLF